MPPNRWRGEEKEKQVPQMGQSKNQRKHLYNVERGELKEQSLITFPGLRNANILVATGSLRGHAFTYMGASRAPPGLSIKRSSRLNCSNRDKTKKQKANKCLQ